VIEGGRSVVDTQNILRK